MSTGLSAQGNCPATCTDTQQVHPALPPNNCADFPDFVPPLADVAAKVQYCSTGEHVYMNGMNTCVAPGEATTNDDLLKALYSYNMGTLTCAADEVRLVPAANDDNIFILQARVANEQPNFQAFIDAMNVATPDCCLFQTEDSINSLKSTLSALDTGLNNWKTALAANNANAEDQINDILSALRDTIAGLEANNEANQ
jgi:hypothetical protein